MRWRRIIVGLAGVLLVAWIVATVRLVFVPTEDDVGKADAVVVLAGSKHERLDRGLELVRDGVAPVLVISDGFDPRQPRANRLCQEGGERFTVVCFTPDPDSTRGEARSTAQLARERDWQRVLLVTSRFHVTRARMLFDRCLDADVDAVGVDYPWTSVPSGGRRRMGEAGPVLDRDSGLLEAQSPQSKSRVRPQRESSSSMRSSPGHGWTCATTAGSSPSIVSSMRACSSVLKSGWFSNGSPFR